MNAIIIVHTSLYIYGSIFVGFVIITFLADWMCGIENMYLCNCIVCLMANSFLEEKICYLHVCFFVSFFKRRMYILCFASYFSAKKRCSASELHKEEYYYPTTDWYWYASTYSGWFVKLTFIWKTADWIQSTGLIVLVLNWFQEQSTCHIRVITSLIIDSYSFMFHFITQLLNKYWLTLRFQPHNLWTPPHLTTNHLCRQDVLFNN